MVEFLLPGFLWISWEVISHFAIQWMAHNSFLMFECVKVPWSLETQSQLLLIADAISNPTQPNDDFGIFRDDWTLEYLGYVDEQISDHVDVGFFFRHPNGPKNSKDRFASWASLPRGSGPCQWHRPGPR